MAYIAQGDITPRRLTLQELVELTDDDKTGEVNGEVLTGILEDVDGRIDAYVRGRYATPLKLSDQVKTVAVDIAVFLLFQRRRRIPEDVQKQYDDAIKFLERVQRGDATLDQPAPNNQTTGQRVLTVDRTAEPQTFSDEQLEGFK
jgi:phage gp36-like protein